MPPEIFIATALSPGLHLLPLKMDTPEARAMIVAIALQESGLSKRRQMGKGPARSYVQFERTGIRGVLRHKATATYAREVCAALDVLPNGPAIYRAIEFQDALAVVFARLLLWTLPKRLPPMSDAIEGWYQYLEGWRPGKPREETWSANFSHAWQVVTGELT